jgi:transcriptional regulator with XRE-family HTH domain
MFEKRFKALLKERGLNVTELAKLSGVSRTTLQSWTAGVKPSVYDLDKVCSVLNLTIDEFVFGRKPKASLDSLFKEVLLHSGTYKIKVTKLTEKDDDD